MGGLLKSPVISPTKATKLTDAEAVNTMGNIYTNLIRAGLTLNLELDTLSAADGKVMGPLSPSHSFETFLLGTIVPRLDKVIQWLELVMHRLARRITISQNHRLVHQYLLVVAKSHPEVREAIETQMKDISAVIAMDTHGYKQLNKRLRATQFARDIFNNTFVIKLPVGSIKLFLDTAMFKVSPSVMAYPEDQRQQYYWEVIEHQHTIYETFIFDRYQITEFPALAFTGTLQFPPLGYNYKVSRFESKARYLAVVFSTNRRELGWQKDIDHHFDPDPEYQIEYIIEDIHNHVGPYHHLLLLSFTKLLAPRFASDRNTFLQILFGPPEFE